MPTKEDILTIIDHTELNPDATVEDIDEACRIAIKYHCASVCVRPEWVSRAKNRLSSHDIPVTTVIAFPAGDTSLANKTQETKQAVQDGAEEIDLVLNRENIHNQDTAKIVEELQQIREAAPNALIKIIIETAALTDNEIVYVTSVIAKQGNIEYVKTSTGYHPNGGASLNAVSLIRQTAPLIGIKASGGVRTFDDAVLFVEVGATRIGSSNTKNF